LAIRRFHEDNGQGHRNICLIPASAHGTNPASAHMAGYDVVVVRCTENGDVSLDDLKTKLEKYGAQLAALMITYPSTHGVFEMGIKEICELVHQNGGQVYLDGANLNAMVGLVRLREFGADVCHMNLHKTFCIPHGGGGPGVGPIGVAEHLVVHLPGHVNHDSDGAVAAAPDGSAAILPISWMYVRMLGGNGLRCASEIAILNANYIAEKLKKSFPILYTGTSGRVAHECIVDVRVLAKSADVTVDDVAKRLIDYGFHAPTMSWPVSGTLMVEPTESEPLAEIDRFIEAMLAIAREAEQVATGKWPRDDNPLHNAPHTALELMADEWLHPYSRQVAGIPVGVDAASKYWVPVSRVDNVYGDRNLICTCPPIEDLAVG
ncbi:aminotransferase class V-fold PLP-dependent enzyme, partial [Ahrensia sp. AH-315-G08]|nr:aminotransferase class V-fold PLP-dependent enzyme [Ahrensia sp. AH-315-G08]